MAGERSRWMGRSGLAGLALLACSMSAGAQASTLSLNYVLYKLGIPVMTFAVAVSEDGHAYRIASEIQATGLVGAISRYRLRSSSDGTVAADGLHPTHYESVSTSRARRRSTWLDFAADGTIAATSEPPADPQAARPTTQETAGAIDPLAAILEGVRAFARDGRCTARVPVFDGKRRFDAVLSDEGTERVSGEGGATFDARRCAVTFIKVAGFSDADDQRDHIENVRAWLAPPIPGAPPFPVRIEFMGGWGSTTIALAATSAAAGD